MPELKHFGSTTDAATLADALREDGACIIDDAMGNGQLDQLKAEIMPYVEATSMGQDDFTGRNTSRTGALVARSEACRQLVMDERLIGACDAFLKPFCDAYQLHLTQLIRIFPQQGEQPLHRDRLAWGGYLPASLEPQLNTIWAVTDFTRENGATRVVPGSNHWEPERTAEDHEIGYAEMTAGSVLVYSGSVIHSGGKNQSDSNRMGLNITYCLGWLRQEENQYLSCPPDIAKDFSPELQALLGYAMGSYALGYFTPPLPPGEGPEITPPDWLFGASAKSWGDSLYDSVSERAAKGAM
ncbi:phytanoyl-CoA dioxygenase family protein [Parerythrobacter jejuensis]|uniref:Phytanoyl-CoA dioxygenase family protein n=1 Tax=Parerythrobacter jejuensis TaxID=795812 RepID=A0A845AW78_9SPHN|nr:phytanoyl-CoA dioxygenase family protein [Parerythrobacter jejuensis]MXP30663.1 phytanoyl-CoA dioxygenase family protein [Parerythrobacter jejuensis]MXP33423.1 phytanoyl-CoA dioxygenase family protein [Parerythrobacter jejuensis]